MVDHALCLYKHAYDSPATAAKHPQKLAGFPQFQAGPSRLVMLFETLKTNYIIYMYSHLHHVECGPASQRQTWELRSSLQSSAFIPHKTSSFGTSTGWVDLGATKSKVDESKPRHSEAPPTRALRPESVGSAAWCCLTRHEDIGPTATDSSQ